jgi:hypothetical protein
VRIGIYATRLLRKSKGFYDQPKAKPPPKGQLNFRINEIWEGGSEWVMSCAAEMLSQEFQ